MTSAAAVMVSVFAIFATLSMMEMKMMGVGLSAAILLDATVIRLVMLPAILVLLGDRAWWPRSRPAARWASRSWRPSRRTSWRVADRVVRLARALSPLSGGRLACPLCSKSIVFIVHS